MKARLLFLFATLTTFVSAQKTEEFYDYNWKRCEPEQARFYGVVEKTDSGWHRRDYFIYENALQMDGYYADQDCKIRNGPFYYFNSNKTLESLGRYVNGKREGIWLNYYPDAVMADSITYLHGNKVGQCFSWHDNGYTSDSAFFNEDGSGVEVWWFDNGNPSAAGRYNAGYKPNGKWQFFHKNGRLSAVEIYNNGNLVSKTYYEEDGSQRTDTTSYDREASFPGGMKAWQTYLEKRLIFPDQYRIENADKAVVVVDAVIDEDGNVTDISLAAPFHPAFNQIAVDVIKHSPKWTPAIEHNRRVKYRIRQAVFFEQ